MKKNLFKLIVISMLFGVSGFAQNIAPVQTYYMPIPEADLRTFLAAIDTAGTYTGQGIYNYISISAIADNTLIYWDQAENGYEYNFSDITDIYSATNLDGTQIWGDGDVSNGAAPGVTLDANDIISAGTVIVIEETVPDSPAVGSVYLGFGDRVGATKPISVVRAGWAGLRDTLHAGAVEVFDTTNWGQHFVVPVGTDTDTGNTMFEYVGAFILAGTDGTSLSIDTNADGTPDVTTTLDQGESYFVNNGFLEGATIDTDQPVQVDVVTGDKDSTYEARFFRLSPLEFWTDSYITPVGTPSSTPNANDTALWVFNPSNTTITATIEYRDAANVFTSTTLLVPAGEAADLTIPATDSGARVYSTGNIFYAFVTADREGQLCDWGFSLMAEDSLTPQTLIGLGLGEDPNRAEGTNKSPIWITPVGNGESNVTVYIDYDADPTTGSNATPDPYGNMYDVSYSLKELQGARVFDPDGDQTGLLIYVVDPDVKVAAVWGQDPELTVSGGPGIDLGTGVPPLPSFVIKKKSALHIDNDNDGYISPGDILQYEVAIENTSRFPVPDLKIKDVLPDTVIYQAGSTAFVNESNVTNSIPDDTLPDSAFPLDVSDYDLAAFDLANGGNGTLPVAGIWKVLYEVEVEDYDDLGGAVTIQNSATVNAIEIAEVSSTSEPIRGKISDYVWFDANTNGVQDAGESGVNGVTVNLLDAAGDPVLDDRGTAITTVTADNGSGDPGYYLLQGITGNVYRVEFVPSALYDFTLKDLGGDEDLDSDADTVTGWTDSFSLGGGQILTDRDAGLINAPSQGVSGHIFNDVNSNGIQDPGEPNLVGVDVLVTDSSSGTQTVTTDANGDYYAAVDVTGTTTLNVDETSLSPNYNLTTANGTQSVNVQADQVTVSGDVGYHWNQLDITKVSSPSGDVSPGDTITYTMVVTNSAVGAHNNIILSDPLPAGTTYVPNSTTVTAPFISGSTMTTNNVGDTFASASWGLSTGTDIWSGDWYETNDGAQSPTQTYIYISGGNLVMNYIWTEFIHRSLDLTGTTSAILTVDYTASTSGSAAALEVAASTANNGTYTALAGSSMSGSTSGTLTLDLSSYISADTSIRFRNAGANWTDTDNVNIHAVNIEYIATTSTRADLVLTNATLDDGVPSNLVTAVDNVDLLPGERMLVSFQATVNATPGVSNIVNVASVVSDEQTTPLTASATDPVAEGTVSGHLYYDENGNGTQDGGEADLVGVDVVITNSLGEIQTVTTDGSGDWSVSVPIGSTSINVDETDSDFTAVLSSPWAQTEGSDPTTVTAVAGSDTPAGTDGYFMPGNVTGHLYMDTNGNGSQDGGEPDLANVDVVVTDSLGVSQTVTTDPDGDWTAAVPAGATSANVDETDPDFPSGVSQTDGDDPTASTAVAGSTVDGGTDGYYLPATINGHLYIDSNGNGTQDIGEPNLINVDVVITDSLGNTQTVTSDASGNYTASVPPGATTADVDETDTDFPTGATQTEGDDPSVVTAVAGANTSIGIDGYAGGASIGDRVWCDENSNGIQDAGEPGIPNVTVRITYPDTSTVDVQTDFNGRYLFSNLLAGTYTVSVLDSTLPSSLASNQTADPDATFDDQSSVTVTGGDHIVTTDFGYNYNPSGDVQSNSGAGVIGDRVWIDADADGIQDDEEIGMGGVIVKLYNDADTAGVYTSLVATTTTGPVGYYAFTNLTTGAYVVEVNDGVTPAGYSQTGDPDEFRQPATSPDNKSDPLLLTEGDVFLNGDFGYQPAGSYSIGDTIYLDTDGDGTLDAGEPGIPGISVTLIADTDGDGAWTPYGATVADDEPPLATVYTDASGNYQFDGLPPGDYIVWVNDVNGVLATRSQTGDPDTVLDASSAVTITNADNLNQDFGYTVKSRLTGDSIIGNTVFLDRDSDGQPDSGEGMEGVTVYLKDSSGDIIETAVTDANGHYLFGGLPTGTFIVEVDSSTMPSGLNITTDPDSVDDGSSQVIISASGEVHLDENFGYQPVVSHVIGGTIWEDADADGMLESAETNRYAGVTVELVTSDGRIIASTQTDANGDYSFADLPAGTYTVDVSDLSNILGGSWHAIGPNPGADNNSQVKDYSVTVGSGNLSDSTADFGYFTAAADLGNRAWWDYNGNGKQDTYEETSGNFIDEPGVTNLAVYLTYTPDSGSPVTLTTFTDENGYYSFKHLLLDEDLTGQSGTYEISASLSYYGVLLTPTSIGASGTTVFDDSNDPNGTSAEPVRGGVDLLDSSADETLLAASYDLGFIPSPTLAVITSFSASSESGQTVVHWETGVEIDTLGFRLERLTASVWQQVGDMVFSNPFGIGVQYYSLQDAVAVAGGTYTWCLIEIDTHGQETVYGPYTIDVDAAGYSFAAWASSIDWSGLNADANADPDADGLTNMEEFVAGTDPVNANSVLRISSLQVGAEGVTVTWQSVIGRAYAVEVSADAGASFLPVVSSVIGNAGETSVLIPISEQQLFFRVVVVE